MDNKISNDNQQYFLATTALEDFWDVSKPIVFLGDWCLRYGRKCFWESLSPKVLPSPWADPDKFKETIRYIDNSYEYLLPILADVLNSMHNEKLSIRAWRIIIGHWLNCCIYILYDRFQAIRYALDNYSNITTIGLSKDSFLIPKDTAGFLQSSKDDLFNLQLFTRILNECGINFPKKNPDRGFPEKNHYAYSRQHRLFPKEMLIGLFRFSQSLFKEKSPVALNDSFFQLPVALKLFLKTKGRVVSLDLKTDSVDNCTIEYPVRNKLQNLFIPKNDFEKILKTMIPELIPLSFVENYARIKEGALERFPRDTKAIFSAVSWSTQEDFKTWAAHMSENGTKLIGTQHGGNYGSEEYLFFENHELSITDRYYTWGWLRDNCRSEVIPAFANKLVGTKKFGANMNEDSILLLTFALPRYADRLDPRYYHFNEYLDYQFRFVAALGDNLMRKLRVRLFFDDFGWDCKERWASAYPNVPLEGWNVKFADSVSQCRICINDNLSTSFLETLSWDKPTILFWRDDLFPLRAGAKSFYDELRSAGILFNTPEEAALALRDIYDDVESWWNQLQRKKAVQKFCDHFARTSPKALRYWADEFNKLDKELKLNHA